MAGDGEAGGGGPVVVALGGGHGLAASLRAIRSYASSVTAVVSVADDGGSSGRLRATMGLPAPGDLRRCLVAMADPDSLWARAFEHRFRGGDLDGHALGNIVIAGLAELTGDFASALDAAAELLGVTGRVLPATAVPVELKADVGGGEIVGQVKVQSSLERIRAIAVVPPDAGAPAEVVGALAAADQVVIGPGSLFTSVLATCVVPDVLAALAARRRGRVYVCNLRPQVPETDGLGPADHVAAVVAHGVPVDTVLVDQASVADAAEWARLEALGASAGIAVTVVPLARPDRSAHDVDLLGAALAAVLPAG